MWYCGRHTCLSGIRSSIQGIKKIEKERLHATYADISKLFSCLASLVGEVYIVGRILYIGLGNSLLGKFTYLRTRSLLNGTQNTRPVFELNAPYINIEFVNDVMGCLCYLNLSPLISVAPLVFSQPPGAQ